MIQHECPHCHEALQIPEQYAEQTGACNKCGGEIVVPAHAAGFGAVDIENIEIDVDKKPPPPVIMEAEGAAPKRAARGSPEWASSMRKLGCGMSCTGCLILFFLPVIVFIALFILYLLGAGVTPDEMPGVAPMLDATKGLATLDKFKQLENGMSYATVCEIIGTTGTVSSSSHIDGVPGVMDSIDTVMYTWKGAGGFGANMLATFQNDRLMLKSQFGLK